jgi:hypothetical protein
VGGSFLSGDLRVVRVGVIVGSVFCLATWVLVQDFGFFGGLGTDPNSMIPMALIFTGGYLAMVRLPVPASAPAAVPLAEAVEGAAAPVAAGTGAPEPVGPPTGRGWWDRYNPKDLLRALVALGAVIVVLWGGGPDGGGGDQSPRRHPPHRGGQRDTRRG